MTPLAPADEVVDTLIIGAGPGGLAAAIYLCRFTRRVIVVDKGRSRLRLVPVSHNYPGFPTGVNGERLLASLEGQLREYGGQIAAGEITRLQLEDGVFVAQFDADDGSVRELRALTVLLATGVADAGLPIERWDEAVATGAVRLCPVCDGYDVIDRRIAVATGETNPVGHALFMRTFSADVTLFARGADALLGEDEARTLAAAGVRYVASPVTGVTLDRAMRPVLHTADGEAHVFDVFYPMLGETARSDLAAALGAQTAECRKLVVDAGQCTTVAGLFAVGDVVQGLNQIAVATGQAAVAATRIHHLLPWKMRGG